MTQITDGGIVIGSRRWKHELTGNKNCFVSMHAANTVGFVPEDCFHCGGSSSGCRLFYPERTNRKAHGILEEEESY